MAQGQSDPNTSLDLPAEMFRSGGVEKDVTIVVDTKKFGMRNIDVKVTEIDGLAVFEGDIILGTASEVINQSISLGIGVLGPNVRWPNGVVPFVTEPALAQRVKAAVDHWEASTPIRFVARTNQADFISFEAKDGCFSNVGRQLGGQVISLGFGCGLGAAIHEIGHALGLFHEQSRSDRDEFIAIDLSNVEPRFRHNFDMHITDAEDLGGYDFTSIMHYPAFAFAMDRSKPTIRTRGGEPIGQRNGLSAGDVASVKLMYPDLNWPKS